MINLIMTDRQLFAGDDGSAFMIGYGPIDAELARELTTRDRVWLRRCFTDPDTGALTATESRARNFPPGLRTLITLRDQTCRVPWCDAPIRHIDHRDPYAEGGATSLDNGQGLCEACNHAKQAPDWRTRAAKSQPAAGPQAEAQRGQDLPRVGARDLMIVTPTGHRYRARVPIHPGVPRKPQEIQLPGVVPKLPVEIIVDITYPRAA